MECDAGSCELLTWRLDGAEGGGCCLAHTVVSFEDGGAIFCWNLERSLFYPAVDFFLLIFNVKFCGYSFFFKLEPASPFCSADDVHRFKDENDFFLWIFFEEVSPENKSQLERKSESWRRLRNILKAE